MAKKANTTGTAPKAPTAPVATGEASHTVAFLCPISLHQEAKMLCVATGQKLGPFMVAALRTAIAEAGSTKSRKAA